MSIDILISFRQYLDRFLALIEIEEKGVQSKVDKIRIKASKNLEFLQIKLIQITEFYIKRFCNNKFIVGNAAFLSSIRVDIVERVRKKAPLVLAKKYTRILKTSMR
jgi:hypothetical protein